MDLFAIIIFACFPLTFFAIFKMQKSEKSHVLDEIKNRNNSRPIGEQFIALDQILADSDIAFDFKGYFTYDE